VEESYLLTASRVGAEEPFFAIFTTQDAFFQFRQKFFSEALKMRVKLLALVDRKGYLYTHRIGSPLL
jgi:hypothetical protein